MKPDKSAGRCLHHTYTLLQYLRLLVALLLLAAKSECVRACRRRVSIMVIDPKLAFTLDVCASHLIEGTINHVLQRTGCPDQHHTAMQA